MALEGTRQQILDLLHQEGPLSVEQLTHLLGLASATIRRHLDILQRDQLVSYQQLRKKLGRPEYVYSLTEAGQESGRRDYQSLLCLLLTNLRATAGPTEGDQVMSPSSPSMFAALMHRVSAQLVEPYLRGLDSPNAPDRTTTLTNALTVLGFAPVVTKQHHTLTIQLHNCPFRVAALCEPSVCSIDQHLIANILAVEPCRQSSIREGHRSCSYTATLAE